MAVQNNSTDVTLDNGEYDYITLSGQELTLGQVDASSDISNLTTTNVSEGSNQYFTNARVKTRLDVEGVISGSSQVSKNTITNFDSNVKTKLDDEGVISGSSQVSKNTITNFDSNVKQKIN